MSPVSPNILQIHDLCTQIREARDTSPEFALFISFCRLCITGGRSLPAGGRARKEHWGFDILVEAWYFLVCVIHWTRRRTFEFYITDVSFCLAVSLPVLHLVSWAWTSYTLGYLQCRVMHRKKRKMRRKVRAALDHPASHAIDNANVSRV